MEEERILIDGVKYKLWTPKDEVKEFEPIVVEHIRDIFGDDCEYFPKQKLKTLTDNRSIPDGFVIDFKNRRWFIVELKLLCDDAVRRIAGQIVRYKNSVKNLKTRRDIYKSIKSIKDADSLDDLINDEKPEIVIIIDSLDGRLGEQFREQAEETDRDIKIIEFKTFRREGAPTVHAHLFEPLFEPSDISIGQIKSETSTKLPGEFKVGDRVRLKGNKPPEVPEWSWSRVWGQERRVKEVLGDQASLIIDEKTRGFWFPLKCLEKVGVTPSEKEIQGPTETLEWTEKEFFEFLKERSDTQLAFLKMIAEHDKVYIDDLLSGLKRLLGNKFGGYIGGLLAGLNNAINRRGKEHLHYYDWDEQGKFYKIESKYRDMIKRYFMQQDQ